PPCRRSATRARRARAGARSRPSHGTHSRNAGGPGMTETRAPAAPFSGRRPVGGGRWSRVRSLRRERDLPAGAALQREREPGEPERVDDEARRDGGGAQAGARRVEDDEPADVDEDQQRRGEQAEVGEATRQRPAAQDQDRDDEQREARQPERAEAARVDRARQIAPERRRRIREVGEVVGAVDRGAEAADEREHVPPEGETRVGEAQPLVDAGERGRREQAAADQEQRVRIRGAAARAVEVERERDRVAEAAETGGERGERGEAGECHDAILAAQDRRFNAERRRRSSSVTVSEIRPASVTRWSRRSISGG